MKTFNQYLNEAPTQMGWGWKDNSLEAEAPNTSKVRAYLHRIAAKNGAPNTYDLLFNVIKLKGDATINLFLKLIEELGKMPPATFNQLLRNSGMGGVAQGTTPGAMPGTMPAATTPAGV